MIERNLTINDQSSRILLSPVQSAPDQTGLFIALFLLFLLFLLISYLFYSFFSIKRYPIQQNNPQTNLIDDSLNNKLIFNDTDDLIDNNGDIILGHKSSFSDCGTSIRSSSIRSSRHHPQAKRSSSYRLCSQASNYLLTPRLSSQITETHNDECLSTTIIVEPNDIQLANALSRSISKYYERQRKPKLQRRTHSCEELMIQTQNRNLRPLQIAASLPVRRSLRQPSDVNHRQSQRQTSQTSFRKKPTTIYELYKSDRMRIANLLVSDP
ncbi:unnamed protein product [Adineta steineri]|uniref:Uncharacterized protein n=1 Tax=Adineta steineri TaxID=433720 RepID=A0A814GVA9_9BILA|nr:unnamed protein product [Adineta steineri]CAF3795430.1 unnamed protein product [Adineta steineri]